MVYIFSTAYSELPTEQVIDWLFYFEEPFVRFNGEDMMCGRVKVEDDEMTSIWFRRTYKLDKFFKEELSSLPSEIQLFIRREASKLYFQHYNYIIDNTKVKIQLGSYESSFVNKLQIIDLAKKIGILTPVTKVVCSIDEIMAEFESICDYVITKPASDIFYYTKNGKEIFIPYTRKIKLTELDNLFPSSFFPSLFQEYIEKEFEIRTVFLVDTFYSMAIFSGKNKNTIDDFRNYDFNYFNRHIPFQLPLNIQENLQLLCQKLDINFCSIDLIFRQGEYYFLEVNPVGQFGMTSLPCNYNIERKIAEILINGK